MKLTNCGRHGHSWPPRFHGSAVEPWNRGGGQPYGHGLPVHGPVCWLPPYSIFQTYLIIIILITCVIVYRCIIFQDLSGSVSLKNWTRHPSRTGRACSPHGIRGLRWGGRGHQKINGMMGWSALLEKTIGETWRNQWWIMRWWSQFGKNIKVGFLVWLTVVLRALHCIESEHLVSLQCSFVL